MRLDRTILDELKGRLPVRGYRCSVRLKRSGRKWVGLSPLVQEKTPSFFVHDDRGFWHDGCFGQHADLIGSLQETSVAPSARR